MHTCRLNLGPDFRGHRHSDTKHSCCGVDGGREREKSSLPENVAERLDSVTFYMQEGKLTNGEQLRRPFRSIPMFAGVLLTGFGGTWITHGACLTCDTPHDIARCSRCQGGICELHGVLLSRASQESGSAEWQGASVACCRADSGCVDRQTQILEYWEEMTGEKMQ